MPAGVRSKGSDGGNQMRNFALPLASLLTAFAVAASIGLPPLPALAQGSPQFGNWGPGQPPPDSEGPDQGASGSGYGAAAPYAAPAPGSGGLSILASCPYDLRGTWRNDGRHTSGRSGAYSATVYVRQYRSWVHAQQDDGTAYFGRCLGSSLQFDMYDGYQYVGRQAGTISTTWLAPDPMPLDFPVPYAAPSPWATPTAWPPYGRGSLSIRFTWTSWYGSGAETWYPISGGYL